MSYFENFVGFKNRNSEESVASATQGYDSYQRFGDDPDGGGTEKFDSEGNSIGVGIQRGNARTRRWGDTEGYQVGNTYTKLEGDAVVDVVGNSSAKRTGWVNNVTFGPTFNTQIGGTVATSLFAVTTLAGFRCNTFVGADVAINAAVGVKVTGGGYYSFGKAGDWKTKTQETEATNQKTEIALAVKKVIGEETGCYVTMDTTVAGMNGLTCLSRKVTAAGNYSVSAFGCAEILGMGSTKIKSFGATTLEGTIAVTLKTSGVATVNGLLIKLG